MNRPRLVAIDWGTSNLRANLLGDDATVIETRSATGGVMAVPDRKLPDGDEALCTRYAIALDCAGIRSATASEAATTRGQWRVAQAAGLLNAHR